jgi:hypothetical protein
LTIDFRSKGHKEKEKGSPWWSSAAGSCARAATVAGVPAILGGREVSDGVRWLALFAWVESGFGSCSVGEGWLELRAVGKLR